MNKVNKQMFQTAFKSVAGRLKTRGPLLIAHNTLTALGVLAICVLAFMFVKPEVAKRYASWSPFAQKVEYKRLPTETDRLSGLVVGPLGEVDKRKVAFNPSQYKRGQQKKWVSKWLARRFHVAPKAIDMIVTTAYETADELKLDPLLILAVISIESRYNPVAQSPVGAQGLMQVMTKVHREKFEQHGGDIAALNPVANIKVGSRILKEYVRRDGSVPLALKRYVGAANLDTDYGYGAKVLKEYAKLQDVASGKRVRALAVAPKPKPKPKPVIQEAAVVDESAMPMAEQKDVAPVSEKVDKLVVLSEDHDDFEEL